MPERKYILGLASVTWLIIIGAAAKFTIHLLTASNYAFLNYHLWGPREGSGACTIVITQNIAQYYDAFEDIQQQAVVINDGAMPYNIDLGVYVCRKLKWPIDKIWPLLKNYYLDFN